MPKHRPGHAWRHFEPAAEREARKAYDRAQRDRLPVIACRTVREARSRTYAHAARSRPGA